MHNSSLLSNTGAELLLDSVIIVSFNKLELLLQGKQRGRQDESHFSSWGFSLELAKPYPQLSGIFFALAVCVCSCGSSENTDFWLNPELRYKNSVSRSLLSRQEGVGRKKGRLAAPRRLCTPASWCGKGAHLVPSTTMKVSIQRDVKLGDRRQRGK